jgi:hypothetical protein
LTATTVEHVGESYSPIKFKSLKYSFCDATEFVWQTNQDDVKRELIKQLKRKT